MPDPFDIAGKRVLLLGAEKAAGDLAAHLDALGAAVDIGMRDGSSADAPDLLIDIEAADQSEESSWLTETVDRLQALRQAFAGDARPARLLILADDRAGRAQGRARAALGRSLAREFARHTNVNIAAPAEGEWRDHASSIGSLAQFLLSPHAAFTIGHTFRLSRSPEGTVSDSESGQRVAIVTGAAGGIGRAVASLLRAHGFAVHDVDVAPGCRHQVDLANPDACRALVRDVHAETSRLDALVNVAGWLGRRPFLDADADYQMKVLGVNFASQHHLCAAALTLQDFAERGVIVNFTSGAGLIGGLYGAASYGFAKGASIGLTEALARANAGRGVRINAFAPGSVDTPMLRESLDAAALEKLAAAAAIGRLGTPDDIAGAVLFLVSPIGRILHGQTLIVDGGGLLR